MVWFLVGAIIFGCVIWEITRRSSRDKSPLVQEQVNFFKTTTEAVRYEEEAASTSTDMGATAQYQQEKDQSKPDLGEVESANDSLAFIDFETTGLDAQSDRIIEVAVFIIKCGVNANAEHMGYSELVNPDRRLPPFIINLTGITDEMLSGVRNASEVLPKFLDYIGDRDIFAYNAEFDMRFLKAEAKRIGREVNNRSFCVMEYFKREFPQLRSYSLDNVCAAFDITAEGASHRASGDAARTAKVYFAAVSGKQPRDVAIRYSDRGEDSAPRIYYVYGHYSSTGMLFYVGVGHGDRAWSKDLSPVWHWYVEKTLAGSYEVKLIREKLTGSEASEMKDALMADHSETLLNRQNPHRDTDYRQYSKFHALRDDNRERIKKATGLEKSDPDASVELLRESIEKLEDYSFMKLEGGLFGQVITDMAEEQGYRGELDALDRLTLLLCKQKQGAEAKQIADRYFSRFKADASLKKAGPIIKRVEKASAT